MTFTLRPLVIPDDCARMAEMVNVVNTEPVSAEQLAEQYGTVPAGAVVYPVLACGADGRPVGYGAIRRFSHDAPGRFALRVLTDPGFRGHGVGRLLYDHLLTYARSHGATLLDTLVRDNDPASLAFAQERGFTVDRQTFESVLDLAQFDEARFGGAVAASMATGIRFFSLADDPGEAFASPPPYEGWAKMVLKGPQVRHDLLLVAADGDRWVGFAINIVSPVNGSVYNGGTGVDRAYRGRGIALALKLLAIRRAKAAGVPYMRTHNDAQNAPMLAVNQKLGYQPSPGVYELVKQAP